MALGAFLTTFEKDEPMKIRVVSISQHGANYHVKAIPQTAGQGDMLMIFPIDKATPTFHKPTEHRSEKDGNVTVKPAIHKDSHIIALDTEEDGRFEIALAEAKDHHGNVLHAAQTGLYDVTHTPAV